MIRVLVVLIQNKGFTVVRGRAIVGGDEDVQKTIVIVIPHVCSCPDKVEFIAKAARRGHIGKSAIIVIPVQYEWFIRNRIVGDIITGIE